MTARVPPQHVSPPPCGGDVLAEMLMQELRVARVAAALVSLGRKRVLRVDSAPRPMIHLVLAGETAIEAIAGDRRVLRGGDVAVVLYGDRHLLGPLPASSYDSLRLDRAAGQPPILLDYGRPPWSARLLCLRPELGYLARAAAAVRAAPSLWCMHAAPLQRETATAALRMDCAQVSTALVGPGAAAFAQALTELLLVHAVRDMYRAVWHGAAQDVRSEETRRLSAAIRAMHDQPDRPWTVAMLAREVGLSRSSFAATFTRKMQIPPLGYLHRVRMEQAAQLLRGGTMSIVEVGRRCGYAVPSSFSRAVRAFYGASPNHLAAAAATQVPLAGANQALRREPA